MTAEGHKRQSTAQAQDELVEARNRLARAIVGTAISGMSQDEIAELTGYPTDLVLLICTRRRCQRNRRPSTDWFAFDDSR
jgi:DNA-directed RNA polymerase specialized sigma24 family protein